MLYIGLFLLFMVIIVGVMAIIIVPQQKAFVLERLGKYHSTLYGGLGFIIPFIDKVRSKVDLREIPLDVPSQTCITKDNTQISVDGVLFIQVTDPKLVTYGTSNYINAVTSLAQTTLRSVIGNMNLDETFEKRVEINKSVVTALDEAAISWGVKLLRYEIKDLEPPTDILKSMQDQITAEREKRAKVIRSEAAKIELINLAEGNRESSIKNSEGDALAIVNKSEADKTARINQAIGEAESIKLIANATKESIIMVAEAINNEGGKEAVNLKVAENYIEQFGKLAKESNTLIIPQNLSDVGGLVASFTKILNQNKS